MNKNNIIGFLLIAVVLIGFSWYNQPSAEEQRAAFVQDSIAKAKHAEMEKASKAAAAKRQTNAKAKVEADSTALFYSALKGQAKKIVLKNEKVEHQGCYCREGCHQGLCGTQPAGERRFG